MAAAALGYRDYRRFAGSLLLTSLGVQLLQTAVFWQVFELTGDALLLGMTGLARALPHMLLSLIGGVFADRFDRVRLIQWGQLANGVLILILAALTLAEVVALWHLFAITFLNAGFSALTQPARTALIPSLIPRGQLVNAVALNATIGQISQIAGPALGGVVVGWLDLGTTYLLNGAIYLAAMAAIVGIRTESEATGRAREPLGEPRRRRRVRALAAGDRLAANAGRGGDRPRQLPGAVADLRGLPWGRSDRVWSAEARHRAWAA